MFVYMKCSNRKIWEGLRSDKGDDTLTNLPGATHPGLVCPSADDYGDGPEICFGTQQAPEPIMQSSDYFLINREDYTAIKRRPGGTDVSPIPNLHTLTEKGFYKYFFRIRVPSKILNECYPIFYLSDTKKREHRANFKRYLIRSKVSAATR